MKRFRKLLVGMATAAKQNSLRMLFAGFAWVGHYTWKVKESSRFLKRLFIAVNMPTRAIIPLEFQLLSRNSYVLVWYIMGSMSHGCPAICPTITVFVFSVIHSFRNFGSMLKVSGSASVKMGMQFWKRNRSDGSGFRDRRRDDLTSDIEPQGSERRVNAVEIMSFMKAALKCAIEDGTEWSLPT